MTYSEIDATNQESAMVKRKKKSGKNRKILHKVGAELRDNPPRIVEKTRREKGPEAAEKQRKAILISKARRAGARIPPKKSKCKSVRKRV
jgi:hypothetical protein